ncbi:MAG: PAS domain S-box protein [Verrucomicrobiota bacterium]
METTHTGAWDLNLLDHTAYRTLIHDRIFGYETLLPSWTYEVFLEHVLPEDRPEVDRKFREATAARSNWNFECRIRRTDGEVRWIQGAGGHGRNSEGKPMWMSGLVQDITERKQAEASHARLAMAVEQAAETVVITDPQGTILYANPAFEKTTGYTCAEVLGQNPRVLKSGRQDAEFYRRMWETLKRGEIWRGHFINKRKDGKLFEEEATISPVRDAAGKVINYVAVKRDVTNEMQLEAQFRQAQKMEAVGTLAGGVAHDFNNILAAMFLQTDFISADENLPAGVADGLRQIRADAERASKLVRQLLLFSRRHVLQPHNLDLNETITTLAKMLNRILGENINMQLKLAAQPMFIHADESMMDQVLMNLAVNARDAMPDGGQLVIETSGVEFDEFATSQSAQARPGSFVCFSVSDTGCGIPPETLPKIFDPFFTTKDIGKGTGLGLATVFGIVQQHQGWLNVYSEVGHGTTFRIYLPRLAGAAAQKPEQPALTAMRGGNEMILLVEDEQSLRLIMRIALTRLGYRVLEASTGVKALEVWKENRKDISLLLTDLLMPDGITGKDLAQRLLRENPKLKVIYMSGYSAEMAGNDFPLQEGVNFLSKPFEAHKLAQTIRDSLDKTSP